MRRRAGDLGGLWHDKGRWGGGAPQVGIAGLDAGEVLQGRRALVGFLL